MRKLIPDPGALFEAVLSRPGAASMLHGPDHWKRVAVLGHEIAEGTPGADPAVVLLFALFHDAERLTDGEDPGHGRRGGELARRLHGKLHYLSDGQMDLLQLACAGHTDGGVSDDPTIGACWDADRLQRWRVGIRPDSALLSMQKAKDLTRPEDNRHTWATGDRFSRAWNVQTAHFAWVDVFDRYGLSLPPLAAEAAEAPPPPGRTVEEARAAGDRIYIRMGLPPSIGRSLAGRDGHFERGVSVFRAAQLEDGRWEADIIRLEEAGSFVACQHAQRPAYLVTGTRRGLGTDGEPVLGDVEVLERLPYQPQMPEWWQRRAEEGFRWLEEHEKATFPFRNIRFDGLGNGRGICDLSGVERAQERAREEARAREEREEASRQRRELTAHYTKAFRSAMARRMSEGMEYGQAFKESMREAEREVMRSVR